MMKPQVSSTMKTVLTAIIAATLVTGCGDSVIETVDEVVRCRSLPGDRTARNVDAWKYEAIREATLHIDTDVKGLTISQLTRRLEQIPGASLKAEIMDFEQVVEYVLLEMEVRGELVRVATPASATKTVLFTKAAAPESTVDS